MRQLANRMATPATLDSQKALRQPKASISTPPTSGATIGPKV